MFYYFVMGKELTTAQDQLLDWIKSYINDFHHSPSIRTDDGWYGT